jgi:hypothetical protein
MQLATKRRIFATELRILASGFNTTHAKTVEKRLPPEIRLEVDLVGDLVGALEHLVRRLDKNAVLAGSA